MDFKMGNKRLMALVLFFFSYLTLCLSVPTKSLVSLSNQTPKRLSFARSLTSAHQGGLVKRVDAKYQQFANDLETATMVDQDAEQFLPFGAAPAIFASHGFQGCIGVAIVSSQGAIIAHYTNAASAMNQARTQLPNLITNNIDALAGAKAWIYAHVSLSDTDTYTSETNNKVLEDIVKTNLHIVPARVKYIEPEDMLVDEQDELLDPDQYPEDLLYGAIMIKHQAGQSAGADVIFINLDWQKAAAENSKPQPSS